MEELHFHFRACEFHNILHMRCFHLYNFQPGVVCCGSHAFNLYFLFFHFSATQAEFAESRGRGLNSYKATCK